DGVDRGAADEGGRVEVGLARAEVDDVAALGAHLAGKGGDGDGGRGLEAGDVRAGAHGGPGVGVDGWWSAAVNIWSGGGATRSACRSRACRSDYPSGDPRMREEGVGGRGQIDRGARGARRGLLRL